MITLGRIEYRDFCFLFPIFRNERWVKCWQPRSQGFSQFLREKPWERGWGLDVIKALYNIKTLKTLHN